MTVAEYIVDELIKNGVTDAFGIPGGVIIKFLYALDDRKAELTPHLNYHEQMAGFAACGYAQASGKLGVAYATRGPGITNMFSSIAEAYQEFLPVLFITAHGHRTENNIPFKGNQELNIINSTSEITKYGANVECLSDVAVQLKQACHYALTGRKGPVILDFASHLFSQEMPPIYMHKTFKKAITINETKRAIQKIKQLLPLAKRPLVLIGDGLRTCECSVYHIEKLGCPIISSRASQDLICQSALYYGYIGSHGLRYSNFILSKADLIIVIGNRMAFPLKSKSFEPIIKKKHIIHIEIEKNELSNNIDNSSQFIMDATDFMHELNDSDCSFEVKSDWIEVCNILQKELSLHDISTPVKKLIQFLQCQQKKYIYVCDVGNNEFWFSRAYEAVRPGGHVLYSKTYGTLGAALGRAIGAYYATSKDIICIIGDQGFQYNIQELQFISYWNLPIGIILLNNSSSGMISDHEQRLPDSRLLHVNEKNGYSIPDFNKIVQGYKIEYITSYNEWLEKAKNIEISGIKKPFVYEISFDSNIKLEPNLPKGNLCQNMTPLLDNKLYNRLEQL